MTEPKPTTGKVTPKRYRCTRCGFVTVQSTNHYGQTYSFGHHNCCPQCPPYAKYPEFGGSTTWECIEPLPEDMDRPPDWEHVTVEIKVEPNQEKPS